MRSHRLLAAAATGVLLATLGTGTALAGAPSGGIATPGEGATVVAEPTITGSFTHQGGIESVSLTIKETGENDPIPSSKVSGCNSAAISCTDESASFSWSPNLPYNGVYRVEAKAESRGLVLHPADTATSTRTFSLAAPPATPAKVAAVVAPESREVTVSWRSNTEPDLLGYILTRNDGGRVEVPKSDSGTVAFVDTATTERGGTYIYAVQAVREGATSGSTVVSEGESSGPVAVSDPPPPPTTTTEAGPGGQPAGPTPPSAPGSTPAPAAGPRPAPGPVVKGGTADLGTFAALRARNTSPSPTAPPEIDTGYEETLPYGAVPSTVAPGDDPVIPGEEPQAALPVSRSSEGSDDRRALLVPIAAGLILFVGALQMRWVAGRSIEPLEAL